ncbi:cell division protein FtsK [Streptomyces noursei]|uniref:cell division protein FtsK n=1 Tax=Streptomyces noursei TaxID=1971 RepID=UPI0037F3B30C
MTTDLMTGLTTAPEHIAAGLLALFATVWGAVLVYRLVRYFRADDMTRASLRLQRRIRRSWRRVARLHHLEVTDRTPTTIGQLTAPNGRPEPRVIVPAIRTSVDRVGVTIRMRILPGFGPAELGDAASYLAATWECPRVSVQTDKPGWLTLRAVHTDPLTKPIAYTPNGEAPTGKDLWTWPVGTDEYAAPVLQPLNEVPGMTIGGLPGYGKTSLINSFLARLAPSDAVQFAVVDGKASTAAQSDYADIAPRLFRFVGSDLAAANRFFHEMVDLHSRRTEHSREVLGTQNMWQVGPSAAWPWLVIVVDEAYTFFREQKGSDPETKKRAALAAENVRLVEHLVRQGRSAGILVVLATQKVTGDALPTSIRDVCSVSLSFAQRTTDAAVAALGEDIRNWPDASPLLLQDPEFVGVASMLTPKRVGFLRVRTPYLSAADAGRIARETAHLTRDPATLLPPPPQGPDFVKAA